MSDMFFPMSDIVKTKWDIVRPTVVAAAGYLESLEAVALTVLMMASLLKVAPLTASGLKCAASRRVLPFQA